jgi:hypothetical protein
MKPFILLQSAIDADLKLGPLDLICAPSACQILKLRSEIERNLFAVQERRLSQVALRGAPPIA